MVQEMNYLLELGTGPLARNVLLSIVGYLQLLYRENTCSMPDGDCARH